MRHRRLPRLRLIVAALATMLVGYTLGQLYWQHGLQQKGVELSGNPTPVQTPARLPLEGYWTLLLAGEPGPACEQRLRGLLESVNRLADRPALQARIRVRLLATREPPADSLWRFIPWATVHYLGTVQRAEVLDVLALPRSGCGPETRFALVGPDTRLYAHLQLDSPARMAQSLRQLIETLET